MENRAYEAVKVVEILTTDNRVAWEERAARCPVLYKRLSSPVLECQEGYLVCPPQCRQRPQLLHCKTLPWRVNSEDRVKQEAPLQQHRAGCPVQHYEEDKVMPLIMTEPKTSTVVKMTDLKLVDTWKNT